MCLIIVSPCRYLACLVPGGSNFGGLLTTTAARPVSGSRPRLYHRIYLYWERTAASSQAITNTRPRHRPRGAASRHENIYCSVRFGVFIKKY